MSATRMANRKQLTPPGFSRGIGTAPRSAAPAWVSVLLIIRSLAGRSMKSMPCNKMGWIVVFAAALAAARDACGAAGEWEYTPYRIHIWLALAPAPGLNTIVREEITATIRRRAEVEFRAAWEVSVSEPPPVLAAEMTADLDRLTVAEIAQAAEARLNDDKLICVTVDASPFEMRVRARELDTHTRLWGPTIEHSVRNPEQLGATTYACLLDAFAPIARIELGETRTATVRLRAGGLALEDKSAARISIGDVLVPILRTNDRFGKPLPDRTAEIPWTLLQVTGADRTNRNLLSCNVYSGMRAPLRGKSSGRRERYAVKARITRNRTEVKVQVRPLKADQVPVPLAGLEVYSRVPAPEEPRQQTAEEAKADEKKNPPEFVGVTDWRGTINITPAAQSPLRLVYIKSGDQLLARLPLAPGRELEQVAEVPDDGPRLQAEGYIKGLNSELLDLVSQRQIIALRFRKRLSDKKFDEAQKLLDELRSLKSRGDIQRDLDEQMHRQIPSPYASVQARIDKLYSDTRSMLNKYLDSDLPNQLMQELRKARGEIPSTTPDSPPAKGPATSRSQWKSGSRQPA